MRIQIDEKTGCWNFEGPFTQGGYGKVTLKGATLQAHRLMAHITIKALMSDQEVVAHKCDNPPCINPAHLFITTFRGNSLDRDTKRRGSFGEKHPNAKLNREIVLAIRAKYGAGLSYTEIRAFFPHVTVGCIQHVCEGKTWKHIT